MTKAEMQHARSFSREIVKTVEGRYLLYVPPSYTPDHQRQWPLMLFLHGAGERGEDLALLKRHGIPRVLEERPADLFATFPGNEFPFIVVSPQCPPDEWWATDLLATLLDEIEEHFAIDADRIYVTGISMGGFGTWALAIANPHRFAAIAPICGGGQPSKACTIAHLPVWTFHGARDAIVPLWRTSEMVEALQRCDGNVQFTVYPEAGHDSWTRTYANPELYRWLLSHRR